MTISCAPWKGGGGEIFFVGLSSLEEKGRQHHAT